MSRRGSILIPSLIIAAFSSGCTDITDVEVNMPETVRAGTVSKLRIIRVGTGSGEWDMGDKDGFNYYFDSYPSGKFAVEVVKDKNNDYCRTTESNVIADGEMRNEVTREMLVKEKDAGEITIAIACHKSQYRFFASDSVVSMQMVIEDAADKVKDTVVFSIIRDRGRM